MNGSEAAVRIQKIFRGYWTRAFIQRMHEAAIKIQQIYRGYSVRKRISPKRQINQHKNSINHQIEDTEKRIALLESQMRDLSQANASRVSQYETERRERAARLIQTQFRGYLARETYSRPSSPSKSIGTQDDRPIDDQLKQFSPLKLWDSQEEEMEINNTINYIVNRLHKDQFMHDSLLGLYGGVNREISIINNEMIKDRKLTASSIVSKLQVLNSLLDEYYGNEDVNQCYSDPTCKIVAECASLRSEIESMMSALKEGINCQFILVSSLDGNKEAEEALLSMKIEPKFRSVIHENNKRKTKLMNSNWWDLVDLYSQDDGELESILELLQDEESFPTNNIY